MKIWVYTLLISFLISNSLIAKTLEQKKIDLKKAFEAGAITKTEFKRAQVFLESPDEKKQKEKSKKTLNLTTQKITPKKLFNKLLKKKDEEKITLKKIEKLGQIIKFDKTYYPEAMLKKLSKSCTGFTCQGSKAGQSLFNTFNRSQSYSQRHPGEMIKAMAMFEVFYSSKLWSARKSIERYKNGDYLGGKIIWKKKDEKEIRSLFAINKGRKAMREALGMTIKTPSKEAIKKFWLLGEFLDLGTGVKNKKLAQDLKQRKEKLANYKTQVANLRKKLQEDLEVEEDEQPVE